LTEPKTKQMAGVLKALKLNETTCLIGTAGLDPVVYRCARNIQGVKVLPAQQFNAYTVLRQKRLLLTRAALEQLRQMGQTKAEAAAPVHQGAQ
jgi:large subunit ribosomal protein L4